MSINNIKCLSVNPHFDALLMQSFLTGYKKECDLPVAFLVFPVLYYADSRSKLGNANITSRLDTLFPNGQDVTDEVKSTGKARFAGFIQRYNALKGNCRDAILVLFSESKLLVKNNNLLLKDQIDYSNYSGKVKDWLRCAYYLGIIFSKYTKNQILYYIGVQ